MIVLCTEWTFLFPYVRWMFVKQVMIGPHGFWQWKWSDAGFAVRLMYLYIACVLFARLPFFDRRCSGSSSWVLSLQVVLQRMVSSYRKLRSCDPSLELHRVCFALVHANSLFHVQTMLTSLLYRCELIIPCLRCEQMDKTRVTHGETKYHAAWANSVGMLDKTPQRFWTFPRRFFEISERGSILTYKLHVRLSLPCLLLMFFRSQWQSFEGLAHRECRVFYAAEGIWMCSDARLRLNSWRMTDVVYSIMVPAFACFCWQTVWEIVYSNEQHSGFSRELDGTVISLQMCCFDVFIASFTVAVCRSSATIVPMQLGRHLPGSVGEGHRGGDHVRKWNEDSRRPKGLGAVFPARKCLSRQVSFGRHDIEAAAPLGGKNPWLGSFLFGTVENCLWPTLETVHAGSDQGRIHARALSLLWRHQSKRWGFMCLARRGLQLPCRGCRPVAA